jgi:hypothetical protein
MNTIGLKKTTDTNGAQGPLKAHLSPMFSYDLKRNLKEEKQRRGDW